MVPDPQTSRTHPDDRPLLLVESVTVRFGGLVAVDEVRLELARGERLSLLGPNGAGKTTLFNVIAGDLVATSGRVTIDGVDCTHLPSRARPGLGVARTYQRTRLMGGLTVAENLYLAQLGCDGRRHYSFFKARRDDEFRELAVRAASDLSLDGVLDVKVGELSHGEQRQLEMAMALVTDPRLMLLDEPASGLSRGERVRLVEVLSALPESVAILLIEHDVEVAMTIGQRVAVLADGKVVGSGTPDEIKADPLVQEIYLGAGGKT